MRVTVVGETGVLVSFVVVVVVKEWERGDGKGVGGWRTPPGCAVVVEPEGGGGMRGGGEVVAAAAAAGEVVALGKLDGGIVDRGGLELLH